MATQVGTFVSVEDLALMRDALNVARNYGQVRDVQIQIEQQLDNVPYTPYTVAMQNAFDRAEGLYREAAAAEYDRMMEEEEDDDNEPVVEDE